MKTFKKNYIGKGTQVPNMQIIKVNLNIAEVMKFKYEYEGSEYITFEVAKLQNPDQFGRDYTVYCTTLEEIPDEKPTKKSRKKKVSEDS